MFGDYGGVNDRFGVVPRMHRQAFFKDRYDRWIAGTIKWRCTARSAAISHPAPPSPQPQCVARPRLGDDHPVDADATSHDPRSRGLK